MESIYLDHNATTTMRAEVAEALARCHAKGYGNPASQHRYGQEARRALEDARERIAELLGANLTSTQPDRLIFTSGGTEANNLAILGIARAAAEGRRERGEDGGQRAAGSGQRAGKSPSNAPSDPTDSPRSSTPPSLIISAIEHASVIEPAEHLLEHGWRLDTLGVTSDGVVRVDQLAALLSEHACLVSVMLANHETGVLQPVAEIAEVCNRSAIPLHTDAIAVVGKLPVNFRALGVAAMSVAAHKFQGPLGIGALLLRDGIPLRPILFGGHQQNGIRPGTESVALAVAMQVALELWHQEQEEHARRLDTLRRRFEDAIKAGYPQAVVHGSSAKRAPNTSNIALAGLDGQILLVALDMAGVACSVGAACASGSTELSPTLRAMDLPNGIVASSLRFSLGATTTEAHVDEAVRRILQICRDLRPQ